MHLVNSRTSTRNKELVVESEYGIEIRKDGMVFICTMTLELTYDTINGLRPTTGKTNHLAFLKLFF
jgi:hypothetical protein